MSDHPEFLRPCVSQREVAYTRREPFFWPLFWYKQLLSERETGAEKLRVVSYWSKSEVCSSSRPLSVFSHWEYIARWSATGAGRLLELVGHWSKALLERP